MIDNECSIGVCSNQALENGYCDEHQAFAPENADTLEGGKHLKLLLEKVDREDIKLFTKGVNGLVAVTQSMVYIVRGAAIERKKIKSYSLKSISSIELKKPGLMTNGHFQIITSGNGDRTKRFSTAFDYAKDENTVMISLMSGNFEKFVELEQLIYHIRDLDHAETKQVDDDVFVKIKKLGELLEANLITQEEFNLKKSELLLKI